MSNLCRIFIVKRIHEKPTLCYIEKTKVFFIISNNVHLDRDKWKMSEYWSHHFLMKTNCTSLSHGKDSNLRHKIFFCLTMENYKILDQIHILFVDLIQ